MKPMTRVALSLLAAAGLASAAAATPEDDLVAREANWSKAIVARDVPMLKLIIAPDWIGQNADGTRSTRAQLLAHMAADHDRLTAMTNHDVHVRLIGDIAIVQGMDTEVGTHKGKMGTRSYSWTDIFQKRGGQWVAIASQNTPIRPED